MVMPLAIWYIQLQILVLLPAIIMIHENRGLNDNIRSSYGVNVVVSQERR